MATRKKAGAANTKAPAATEKKAAVVKAPVSKPAKTEMVAIFKTTYGYYRYWVKNILADGGIIKYKFIKNPDSYAGVLSVAKADAEG
jgi:lipopolysaccharide export LptBFGC system permease protein LptF